MSILNKEEVDNFIKNLLNKKRQIMVRKEEGLHWKSLLTKLWS